MPIVSIITPVYNGQEYIKHCVMSVLNQQFVDFEHLIVDDGSTDNSWEIMNFYAKQDPRVRIFKTKNNGMAASRKFALNYAKGEWVAFLDADDEWLPEKLSKQLTYKGDSDLIFTSGYFIGDFEGPWRVPDLALNGCQLLDRLIAKNFIPIVAVIVKRELLNRVEAFSLDRAFDTVADYDVWLRLCKQDIRIKSLSNEFLFNYRIHSNQSTASSRRLELLETILKLISYHSSVSTIDYSQAQTGYVHHIREALDYFLSLTSRGDAAQVVKIAKDYLNAKWTLAIIETLLKIDLRLSQVLSWRLLQSKFRTK